MLLSLDDEEFEYDSLGNLKTYKSIELKWNYLRNLEKFGDIATYTYNASGIRTHKKVGNAETQFYLNGNKIISQITKQQIINEKQEIIEKIDKLLFYYGIDGLTGFNHNGTEYIYKKNIQNDIIGIYDNNGQEIVKYTYDAWGNCITKYLQDDDSYATIDSGYNGTDTSITNRFIAFINPFRYRSYYYDEETKLYYLNSRYYDPQICRFINADDISILSQGKDFFNGLNLYAYCGNNPVMFIDTFGTWPISISTLLKILSNTSNRNRKNSINLEVEQSSSLFDGVLKYLTINFEYTVTVSKETPSMFYSYYSYNMHNNVITNGVGLNLNDSFGISFYITSDISAGIQLQMDQFHFGASAGLDGIGFNFGFNIGNTTHDFNINISYITIATAAIVASLPIPGSRIAALLMLLIGFVV